MLKSKLKNCETLPEEIVLDLVSERINKNDCQINGWVLDGCPQTIEEVAKLRDLGIFPQMVVVFDLSDAIVYDRLEQRRFDPVTAQHYNLLQDKLSKSVLDRLVQAKEDTHSMIEKKLVDYRDLVQDIQTEFKQILIRINAEEPKDKVFKSFCKALENPL